MRRLAILVVLVALVAVPATASPTARIFFEDTVPAGKSSYVRFKTHKPASFRIVLRVPTQGRAQLFSSARERRKAAL